MYYYWLCDAFVFFFKQKTAYEMRISDWSSDVCSSDLRDAVEDEEGEADGGAEQEQQLDVAMALGLLRQRCAQQQQQQRHQAGRQLLVEPGSVEVGCPGALAIAAGKAPRLVERQMAWMGAQMAERSEERRVGQEGVSTCRARWAVCN